MQAPIVCLKIKLGPCRNMPTKDFYLALNELRLSCDRARNMAFRVWQRWREDNPDWKPEQRRIRGGSLKFNAENKPIMERDSCSQSLEKLMYKAARGAAPKFAAAIAGASAAEVRELLKGKVPYDHAGDARFKWQAILNYEIGAPTFRNGTIPLPSQNMAIGYEGRYMVNNMPVDPASSRRVKDVGEACRSAAVIRFPMWSETSGIAVKSPIVALNVGELRGGHRRWLRLAARGDEVHGSKVKLRGSELVYRDGAWYVHLMLRPPLPAKGPDESRCAVLTPLPPGSSKPFELKIPGDKPGSQVAIRVGGAVPYAKIYERLDVRCKAICSKSKKQSGGGHGRRRFYAKVKPIGRAKRNEQARFTNQMLADVLRICLQNNCGSLLYREPTMPLREQLWFAARGAPFGWSIFAGRLKHKCEMNRIQLLEGRKKSGNGCPRISLAEHQSEYAAEWTREVK